MANSLQTNQGHKMTLSTYLTGDAVKNKINQIIGNEKDGAKFISTIISSVQATPALKDCTPQSILSCALTAYSLNLSPSPQLGQVYLIPYKNNKLGITEAQFQIGSRAYVQLAIRSGYYKKINVVPVKEGELIKYDPFNEEIETKPIENPIEREHAKTIGYYGMFEYLNGYKKAMYWSKEKMLQHADRYSKSFKASDYIKFEKGEIPERDLWKYSSPWYNNFDAMAEKTLIKQLLKWGVLSTELQEAISKDQAVIDEDGNATYVDNEEEDFQNKAENEEEILNTKAEEVENTQETKIEEPTSQVTLDSI